ncbi:hypothetical protein NEMBOFW57_001851 [Staphylotrichum longicolle]|uniref:Beta-galactosidase domain-containing protein n=1 Tax=Staphylotrichum longicolle TaxID=669026 RepID=A0AAD4F345_9PEZI|nr:hypothetical protein NEMBOFW57_001851 [Staphylotrichum longicolle]
MSSTYHPMSVLNGSSETSTARNPGPGARRNEITFRVKKPSVSERSNTTPDPHTITIHTSVVYEPVNKEFLENMSIEVNTKSGAISNFHARSSPDIPSPLPDNHIDLRDKFVLPGLVDSHTHIFLHSDKERFHSVQMRDESPIERTVRATNHARAALLAGYTTYRDLGTEGLGRADASLRDCINRGLTPGPRMFVATEALASSGSYEIRTENLLARSSSSGPYSGRGGGGPLALGLPRASDVGDGTDGVRAAVRRRVGDGADLIKFYADYRRRVMRFPPDMPGPGGQLLFPPDQLPRSPASMLFAQDEMDAIVQEANMAQMPVAAHAAETAMARMAAMAGVTTVEHVFEDSWRQFGMMVDEMLLRGTIWVPTLATAEEGFEPAKFERCKKNVKDAFDKGVMLAAGGDTGVFNHGLNARELEIMMDAGIPVADVLTAATFNGWYACGEDRCGYRFGWWEVGNRADIIALDADLRKDRTALRKVSFVMKDSRVWKRDGVPVDMVVPTEWPDELRQQTEEETLRSNKPLSGLSSSMEARVAAEAAKEARAADQMTDSDQHDEPAKRAPRPPNFSASPPSWDNASLFLLGQRALLFSGEFHPFRLPVPSLWADVLEKMKALGLNAVWFDVPWALLEGKPGEFRAEGVFDLAPLFEAAGELGLWLVARPGPYITTDNYVANVAAMIAKAQITNGGRVILYQPESEYSVARTLIGFNFPDPGYMQYVEDQARKAGIVVPFINNDVWNAGHNAPGTGVGQVDVYGHNSYPLDEDCNDLGWTRGMIRDMEYKSHLKVSPSTPYAVSEFQGGVIDLWGGPGFARCGERFNHEQSRVWYKSNFAAGVKIFNVYMAIAEDRTITREKYSELKLQAQFGRGSFFFAHKDEFRDRSPVSYTLTLPTSKRNMTIPQLGGTLTMPGRDTRIHVTDYELNSNMVLVYCTAEIFTWQQCHDRTVLILYGEAGETHELLLKRDPSNMTMTTSSDEDGEYLYAQWKIGAVNDQFIRAGDLHILLLDRQHAYTYWVTDVSGQQPLIVRGPYLVRSASLDDNNVLHIRADFNQSSALDLFRAVDTATVEILGVPRGATAVVLNGDAVSHTVSDDTGSWVVRIDFEPPAIPLPDLAALEWRYLDSLPELQPSYSDSAWPRADLTTTNNTYLQSPLTPTSLYASDYGFHAGGALLFRGHFTATGAETGLTLHTQGGRAFASAAFLDGAFLGSWPGNATASARRDTYPLRLAPGQRCVLTVVVDNMGNAQNVLVGGDEMKAPAGILEYRFETSGRDGPGVVEWKVTGNLGGEEYVDKVRGPLNEGGLFAERMGYHQPGAPADRFVVGAG